MPRTGRGGSRQGTPGTAYSNRSDLAVRKVPVMVGPSPQYGTAVAQQRAQQAMPIAAPPGPPSPMPAPAPRPVTPIDAPSDRPAEHVMAGASVGPGPGPEALGPLGQQMQGSPQTVGDFLTRLAAMPGAPADIQALATFTQSRS